MNMEDSERKKLKLLLYMFIGLIISLILGVVEFQLLLDKSTQYRENMLWKYTIFLYCLTGTYTVWLYFFRNYLPVLNNLMKFIVTNFVLSLPYFSVLIITKTVSRDIVLMYLPALIILLAGGFIWFISFRIDPDVGEYSPKIILKGTLIIIIVITIAVFNDISEGAILFLASIIMLGESLLLLRQVRKKMLNPSQKPIEND